MPSNRERRAGKQRRRDAKRGRTEATGSTDGADSTGGTDDPGLSVEALVAVLRSTAADLAGNEAAALTGLRHTLAEHLARRRARVLAACDAALTGMATRPLPPSPELGGGLGAALAAGDTVAAWAERERVSTEDAAVATVRVLAG